MGLIGWIDDHEAVGSIIAQKDLHAFRTQNRPGGLAARKVLGILEHFHGHPIVALGDGEHALIASGGKESAGKGLAMDGCAGFHLTGRRAIGIDRLQSDTIGRRIALHWSIGRNARDPEVTNWRGIAMVSPGLRQLGSLHFAIGERMPVNDLDIAAAIEIDGYMAVMVNEVKRTRTGQRFLDRTWVSDFDIGVVTMSMERNTALEEMDRVVVGLDGNDGAAIVDTIELALPGGFKGPAVFGLTDIERGDAGIGMIPDENAIERDVGMVMLLRQSAARHDERERC